MMMMMVVVVEVVMVLDMYVCVCALPTILGSYLGPRAAGGRQFPESLPEPNSVYYSVISGKQLVKLGLQVL